MTSSALLEQICSVELLPLHIVGMITLSMITAESIGNTFGYRPSRWLRRLLPAIIQHHQLLQVYSSRFIIFTFFLLNFCFFGYLSELIVFACYQHFVAFVWLVIPTLLLAWIFTYFMAHCLNQVLKPKIAAPQHLLGRFGTIRNSSARPGQTAMATIRDRQGQLQWFAVEPEYGELKQYSHVILIAKGETSYIAQNITASNDRIKSSPK